MEQAGAAKVGAPWLTLALLAVLIAVFVCQLVFGFDQPSGMLTPSIRTLVAFGASSRSLIVDNGEWFRIIAAPFLHGSLLHIGLNGLVLLWGGSLLERMLGRAWFAAIYAVSGVTGSLMSITINPPSIVSVGASGALMGLMASLFVVSFHFPAGPVRAQLRMAALQVLIPSMLPVVTAMTGEKVDFGAHLGGALGGAFMALILLALWPRTERWPRARWLAAAIGFAGLAAAVVTAGKVQDAWLKERRDIELQAMLIPNAQLPRTDAEWKAQIDQLTARYPHDPRPRLVRGMTQLDAGDTTGAEQELRAALTEMETVRSVLPAQVERLLRTNLAMALAGNGKKDEAKTVAAPVCGEDTAQNRSLRTRVKRLDLCD